VGLCPDNARILSGFCYGLLVRIGCDGLKNWAEGEFNGLVLDLCLGKNMVARADDFSWRGGF